MGLSDEEKKAVVAYRTHLQLFHWNLAVNRLCYGAYYIVTAMMINDGLQARTHAGVLALLAKEYVTKNKITVEERRLFAHLFQMRQTGDYGDCFDYVKEDIEPLISVTEAFINKIAATLS